MSADMWVWNMPSWPVSQVAIDGIVRWLVQEQKMTAPISSGRRPDRSSAAVAASSASSSSPRAVYIRVSMPVL